MSGPHDASSAGRFRASHAVAVLLYLTTLTYLLVLAMTLWLGGAVLVESWLKRRSARTRARRAS